MVNLFRVALYMSAWIEIPSISLPTALTSSRTLYECVNWNFIAPWSFIYICLSHSIWVRELKYDSFPNFEFSTDVALYMSAWIEIECWLGSSVQSWSHSIWVRELKYRYAGITTITNTCRTLYECVNWNNFGYRRNRRWYCRTLYECVNWNSKGGGSWCRYLSRTLYECVNWNDCWPATWALCRGRTLYECVNWNR